MNRTAYMRMILQNIQCIHDEVHGLYRMFWHVRQQKIDQRPQGTTTIMARSTMDQLK